MCVGVTLEERGIVETSACLCARLSGGAHLFRESLTSRVLPGEKHKQEITYLIFSSCDTRWVSARYNETQKKKKVKCLPE
jgi:hypothetical protein